MASKRHSVSSESEDGLEAKRFRLEPPTCSQKHGAPVRVELNPADCNLDFDIDGTGLQGHALHEQGFAYCWSGARANAGITGGKYCFGCKIVSEQVVDMADTPFDQQHVCRVGISRGDDPVGNLGETSHSFGFGGTGKFSSAGKFSDYGTKFGVGDTIVCAVDLENKPLASIGFSKNGKWLGIARQFDAKSRDLSVADSPLQNPQWESAFFPHVLLKNVVVQLQFSIEDGLIPEEGYKPWSSAIEDGNVIVGPSFSSPRECEVLMMVGLPASGKTTWVEEWVKKHPEKRYVVLGTNLALEQMKVPGLLRKQNYGERFERLMDRATGIFNTLLARAAKTPRNYILDQTNVYRSARNRKLKPFTDYRKVAVVIFPTADELKTRADKRFREMGKEVPADAVNEMLAHYVLPMSKDMPGSNEFFDEVIFPELSRGEAQGQLDEMKLVLRSPNLNVKGDFSPYSRESSVQSSSKPAITNFSPYSHESSARSFSSPAAMNFSNYSPENSVHLFSGPVAIEKEATSVVAGRPITQTMGLVPGDEKLNYLQVNPAYSAPGSSVGHQPRLSESNFPLPSNSLYGNYSKDDRTPFQSAECDSHGSYPLSNSYNRNASERSFSSISDVSPYKTHGERCSLGRAEFDSYGSYPVSSSYSGNASERSFSSIGDMSPYQTHGERDSLRRTSFGSPSSFGRFDGVYPSTPPSYRNPGAHLHDTGAPQVEHNFARSSPNEWHSPHQSNYSSPYAAPPPRTPSGIPSPMNPPRGSGYQYPRMKYQYE